MWRPSISSSLMSLFSFCFHPLSGHVLTHPSLFPEINSFPVLQRLVPPLTALNKDSLTIFLTFCLPLFSLSLTPSDLCFLWAHYTSPSSLSFPSVKIVADSTFFFLPHLQYKDLYIEKY